MSKSTVGKVSKVRKPEPMPPFNGPESVAAWNEFYAEKPRGRKARTVTIVESTLSPSDDQPKKGRVKWKCKN